MVTANKKNGYPGCLAHAVTNMFYGVVANQRQPHYTCNVLQRRCQPRPTIMFIYILGAGGGDRGGGVSGIVPPDTPDKKYTKRQSGAVEATPPCLTQGLPYRYKNTMLMCAVRRSVGHT